MKHSKQFKEAAQASSLEQPVRPLIHLSWNSKALLFKAMLLGVFVGLGVSLQAQISGTVFSDYNASGTRTTSSPDEPLAAGIVVTAYNSAGTILASYTTTSASAPNLLRLSRWLFAPLAKTINGKSRVSGWLFNACTIRAR